VKRVFVVRRSDGQYRSGSAWSPNLRDAKVWYRKQDAGMSLKVNGGEGEVVELHAFVPREGEAFVSLPIGHDVLADYLENLGMLDQAMELRRQ
jgi:hypothetical protein